MEHEGPMWFDKLQESIEKEKEKQKRSKKEYIKTKDKRLKISKYEISLAKQEFLKEMTKKTEAWFDKRVKKL